MIESILVELFTSFLGNLLQQIPNQGSTHFLPEIITIVIVAVLHFISKLLAKINCKIEFHFKIEVDTKKNSND